MAEKGGKKAGKKGKVKLSLDEFLEKDKNVPEGFNKKNINWADAMDDDVAEGLLPLSGRTETVVLPTAPKSSRPNEIDTSRVPTNPPFKVHMGNIPYETTENDIKQFFRDLDLIDIQLPREERGTGRTRGFGYAEFQSREGMIEALKLNQTNLNNRPLRVSLPEESNRDDNRRDRGSGFASQGDEDRTAGDWRRAPREQPPPQMHNTSRMERTSAPSVNREEMESGPWRSQMNRPPQQPYNQQQTPSPASNYGTRNGYEPRESRGYDNPPRSYDDRKGGYSDRRGASGYENFGTRPGYSEDRYRGRDYEPGNFRDNRHQDDYDNRKGGGYERSYDRPPQRDFDRRDTYNRPPVDRGYHERPTTTYQPPATSVPEQTSSRPDVVPPTESAPKERPKLMLQKRTIPAEEIGKLATVSKNIFGEAKPVDTTKKEKEVEEKLRSLDIKSDATEIEAGKEGRNRTISSSSNTSATRSRKESETSNVTDHSRRSQPVRRQNLSTSSDHYERREEHIRDNRGPRDHHRGGRFEDHRDDRGRMDRYDNKRDPPRRQDRGNDRDRNYGNFGRRDDRNRSNNNHNPKPSDDRPPRIEKRDTSGVNGSKKEKEAEYTMKNKYEALGDEEGTVVGPVDE